MTIYRGCNQRIPEYHSWVSLCKGMEIQSYVELGVGSASFMVDIGVPRVVTVDLLPNGLQGIPHIQGDSHDLSTLHQVLKLFVGLPECVFIDAAHDYDSVRHDFDMWYPAATRLVGFHDILMDGVNQFWNEVKRQYPSVEIIGRDPASGEQWQRGSGTNGDLNVGGVGVLFKGMDL